MPLGWLCTTSSAVVPGVRHAGTNTSGSEIDVLERVPRDRTCQARRRCLVERQATAKTSTVSPASVADAIEIKAINRVDEKPLEEDSVLEHHTPERHRIVTVARIGQ